MQSLETPNGLIANMYGLLEGRRHDAFMLGVSGMWQFIQPSGEPHVIYSDPAYGLLRNILSPFCGAAVTQEQQEFKKAMSQL